MARLFFALWPDDAAAQALAALSTQVAGIAGGKPVPAEKIHLTLAFLGDLPEDRRKAACDVASRCRGTRFVATFDCIGSFRGARVAWAGMREPAAPLVDLRQVLESGLRTAGFALEERDYAPHITLARRIARPVARRDVAPVAWTARDFSLVRTQPGTGGYTRVETWNLEG